MHTHVATEDAFSCPNPWLICHQVNAEPVESYQPMRFHQGYYNLNEDMRQEVQRGRDGEGETGVYLEQGSLCWVQLGVAFNLWVQRKLFSEVFYFTNNFH